ASPCSFPTRRSSDLVVGTRVLLQFGTFRSQREDSAGKGHVSSQSVYLNAFPSLGQPPATAAVAPSTPSTQLQQARSPSRSTTGCTRSRLGRVSTFSTPWRCGTRSAESGASAGASTQPRGH